MTGIAIREEQPVRLPEVLTNDQLKFIANTEFVPKGLRGNIAAILACVATGRALGIDDMSALRSIHIVDGRPTFSAELMVKLARGRGHSITGSFGDSAVTVRGKRADNGDEIEVTWTMDMARRAGLADKANWKRYPESMLWARAVSQLCRMLFADVFAGQTYTAEELGGDGPPPGVDVETGEIVDERGSAAPHGDNGTPVAGEPSTVASDEAPRSSTTSSHQRRAFAIAAKLDRDQEPLPNPPGDEDAYVDWGDYMGRWARREFGVSSRSELSEEQWQQVADHLKTAEVPFR